MNNNVAILGAGFIGQRLLEFMLAKGYNVRVLDKQPCPKIYEGKLEWVCGDFADINAVKQSIKGTSIVFHLISSTVPGDTMDENEEIRLNVNPTINLLRLCIENGIKRLIFSSSSSIYGIQENGPIKENIEAKPISSHGIQKSTIEKFIHLYNYKHGMDSKIIRLANPYGIGQSIYGRQGFVAIATRQMLNNQPVIIRGDGSTVRDFIYIDDVVRALYLLMITDSKEEVFNIGSGVGLSLNQVIMKMKKIINKEISVQYTEERTADIPISILDITKARLELGFTPNTSFHEGLYRTFLHHGLLE